MRPISRDKISKVLPISIYRPSGPVEDIRQFGQCFAYPLYRPVAQRRLAATPCGHAKRRCRFVEP
ncbi:hypothetical protein SAMN02982996_01669 [Lonsdalea quercina]|uniref:Uncharacterized protein n=1 Tax=Lonsdalea quercina TaxID=71657 RepID=A0A1H4BFK7_9GAMM|nr:hypothetical protein SAMN02982996_01669 [Lonsdalea quercina]